MRDHAEQRRLDEDRQGKARWRKWGPYLSERQWGTVREDYSAHGAAWDYLPHDHARSRAYRWGEDGIAGISDEQQRLCLCLVLWNGRDPILKERLFGLTNREGNHGEDVKELYEYLDATPSHSYLKMLYKYPLREFPYSQLVEENRRRGKDQPEFELLDSGVFDDDRYFDVFVEYAKADCDEILMLDTVHNRGQEDAAIHVLPQLWFRNDWSWDGKSPKPELAFENGSIVARHQALGDYRLDADGEPTWLFCDNETNTRRLFGSDSATQYAKDAFHDYVVSGNAEAVNPAQTGTKAGACHRATVPAGGSAQFRLRLLKDHECATAGLVRESLLAPTPTETGNEKGFSFQQAATGNEKGFSLQQPVQQSSPFRDFDAVFAERRQEADAFYADLQADIDDADARLVQRKALAGMIWNKQFYNFDVPEWLKGDAAQSPPPVERHFGRNREWAHLSNADIISMPDKWEYPWYAAWDLAFHMIPIAMIDPEFAKDQLVLLTREWYMHLNGQLSAYEWAFGDVNLTGQFLCAREAVREFKRRGVQKEVSCAAGKIICVSSVHEVIPWAGHVNYAASKGGVMLLMKSIAQEVAPWRIRVNSICPGAIRTPINMPAWATPKAYAELLRLIPYKRIGEVEDIARLAVWLASDEADYITGTSLFVDGGMTLYPGFEAGG